MQAGGHTRSRLMISPTLVEAKATTARCRKGSHPFLQEPAGNGDLSKLIRLRYDHFFCRPVPSVRGH